MSDLSQAKLILVGVGGAGKSALLHLSDLYLANTSLITSFEVLDLSASATDSFPVPVKSEFHAILIPKPLCQENSALPVVDVNGTITRQTVLDILANPERLYQMAPHTFELFIAEIYRGLGYQVALTKRTRDGGVDMFLEKVIDGMSHKYAVQCKHTRKKHRRIGVALVRELMGVMVDKPVIASILVTNTLFSRDALEYTSRHSGRLFCVNVLELRSLMLRYITGCA